MAQCGPSYWLLIIVSFLVWLLIGASSSPSSCQIRFQIESALILRFLHTEHILLAYLILFTFSFTQLLPLPYARRHKLPRRYRSFSMWFGKLCGNECIIDLHVIIQELVFRRIISICNNSRGISWPAKGDLFLMDLLLEQDSWTGTFKKEWLDLSWFHLEHCSIFQEDQ